MGASEHCQVLTTTDTRAHADALARGVVEARLAACGQVVGPITSTYWWEGSVQTAEEWQIIFKTRACAYEAIEAYLREHHSYAVPEILCLPVAAGNPDYLAWLDAEVQPA